MKTIGDIKLNHNMRAHNQAEGDNTRTIQSMISNMSFASNNQRSSSRLAERKSGNGCLSQDRSLLAGPQRANLSFGHGPQIKSKDNSNGPSSLSQSRPQSSINAYKTVDNKPKIAPRRCNTSTRVNSLQNS